MDDNVNDDKKIYAWTTISTLTIADLVYIPEHIDNLISERGVSINHDYLAIIDVNENHTWYTNPVTNNKEIYPEFDNELAYMQSQREAGLLWTPTMATFGDYLLLLANVYIITNADGTYTVTNNNDKAINGLSLLAEADIASVTIDGEQLVTFGGNLGSKEIVIPSLDAGHSVTISVSYK